MTEDISELLEHAWALWQQMAGHLHVCDRAECHEWMVAAVIGSLYSQPVFKADNLLPAVHTAAGRK